MLGLLAVGVTFARTFDVPYTQYRLADVGLHPLGMMWSHWVLGLSTSYLCVRPPFQPIVAFGLAVAWSAYFSDVLHAPCRVVVTDGNVADYIRAQRTLEAR